MRSRELRITSLIVVFPVALILVSLITILCIAVSSQVKALYQSFISPCHSPSIYDTLASSGPLPPPPPVVSSTQLAPFHNPRHDLRFSVASLSILACIVLCLFILAFRYFYRLQTHRALDSCLEKLAEYRIPGTMYINTRKMPHLLRWLPPNYSLIPVDPSSSSLSLAPQAQSPVEKELSCSDHDTNVLKDSSVSSTNPCSSTMLASRPHFRIDQSPSSSHINISSSQFEDHTTSHRRSKDMDAVSSSSFASFVYLSPSSSAFSDATPAPVEQGTQPIPTPVQPKKRDSHPATKQTGRDLVGEWTPSVDKRTKRRKHTKSTRTTAPASPVAVHGHSAQTLTAATTRAVSRTNYTSVDNTSDDATVPVVSMTEKDVVVVPAPKEEALFQSYHTKYHREDQDKKRPPPQRSGSRKTKTQNGIVSPDHRPTAESQPQMKSTPPKQPFTSSISVKPPLAERPKIAEPKATKTVTVEESKWSTGSNEERFRKDGWYSPFSTGLEIDLVHRGATSPPHRPVSEPLTGGYTNYKLFGDDPSPVLQPSMHSYGLFTNSRSPPPARSRASLFSEDIEERESTHFWSSEPTHTQQRLSNFPTRTGSLSPLSLSPPHTASALQQRPFDSYYSQSHNLVPRSLGENATSLPPLAPFWTGNRRHTSFHRPLEISPLRQDRVGALPQRAHTHPSQSLARNVTMFHNENRQSASHEKDQDTLSLFSTHFDKPHHSLG